MFGSYLGVKNISVSKAAKRIGEPRSARTMPQDPKHRKRWVLLWNCEERGVLEAF
jgi:hypothetical protein